MWPDHESPVDYLGFEHLVSAVVDVVTTPTLLPTTVGIFGDWGSGKSSLLNMACARLDQRKDTLVLKFNGWRFEGYDDAKAALMQTILESVAEHKKIASAAKDLAAKLLKRVNLMRVMSLAAKYGIAYGVLGPVGLGLAAATSPTKPTDAHLGNLKADDLDKLLKEAPAVHQTVQSFRDEYAKVLAKSKLSTLVVVVDDLDRCLPETVIATLEAIRLFLSVEHSAFLIAADERLVRYAIGQRYPQIDGNEADVGRDYLEKMVQYSVRVPPLGYTETQNYLALLFSKVSEIDEGDFSSLRDWTVASGQALEVNRMLGVAAAREILGDLPEALAEALSLAERLAPILSAGMHGNPRQSKRFLNTLALRTSMAASRSIDLRQSELAKLMCLEYFRPESFKRLAAWAPAIRDEFLSQFEAAARDGEVEDAIETEDSIWLSDEWLRRWLAMDPPLAGVDLSAYFYFARDRLGIVSQSGQRLTPNAQEVLGRLVSKSEAVRGKATETFATLASAEHAAILEELMERTRREGREEVREQLLRTMFGLVQKVSELGAELLQFLRNVPQKQLPVSAASQVLLVFKDGALRTDAISVLTKWASGDGTIALAASAQLDRAKK